MSLERPEWPEVGELAVASVRRIESYGAYVQLDEYGKVGLLHISEISSRWVRNIRNHVRQGQKVVLQVLRVDRSRGQIDLSLRRVSMDERRKKIEDWKKNRRAETLLRSAENTLGMTEKEIYEEMGAKLVEMYGSLYAGLEAAAKRGAEAMTDAGVPERIAKVFGEIVKDKIVVKRVTINGVFEITSMDPKGVEVIRRAVKETAEAAEKYDAKAAIYTMGAPKYRVDVTADDYKKAEAALEEMVAALQSSWSEQDGEVSFSRE